MLATTSPFPQYFDINGDPLDSGYLFFGVTNLDPETNPSPVFWDAAGLLPALQPIRTLNGYAVRNGSPALVYAATDYSLSVRNKRSVLLYFAQNSAEFSNGSIVAATLTNYIANLASSVGASRVGFLQAGAGAVLRTLQAKARDLVNVNDFIGVDPAGVTDSTAGINAALLAGLRVDFGGAGKTYKVSGPLMLRSGHRIRGDGATITQVTNNTELFNYEGKSNIEVFSVNLAGVGTDYTDSDSSRSVAIFGSGSETNINVHDCTFTGFSYAAMRAKGATGIRFCWNTITGPGKPTLTSITSGKCYGFLADVGCVDVLIEGNSITKTAQGIRVEASSDIRIVANKIYTITGQHGIYAGASLANIQIIGNTVRDTDLIGIKVQNADAGLADTVGVVVVGNIISNAGDQGILIYNSAVAPIFKLRDVVCSFNVVKTAGTNGINLTSVYGGVVHGNRVRNAMQSAIIWSECDELSIHGNKAKDSVLSAYRDQLASTNVSFKDNSATNCASGAVVGDKYGLLIQGGSEYMIDGNVFNDANAKMEIGVNIAGGVTTSMSIINNVVTAATTAAFKAPASAVTRLYYGNSWGGALPTATDTIAPTVASAPAVMLPQEQDVVSIGGTANITSILVNGHAGRRVTLIFLAALTVVDGSNLRLAGNFVTTADDTLTLACDGLNWAEVSRSAN